MNWDDSKLGDVAKVISGYAFKGKDFSENKGVPVIKIKNIQKEKVVISDEYFLDESFLSINSKFHCVKDDVLISLTGSHITLPNSVVGRVAKYHYDFTSLLNQRGGKIVVTDENKLVNNYLYYYLCQHEVRTTLALFGRGGANQVNISPSNVESIKIDLPPLQTQKRIADILSTYDDLIENNLKRIKLLEQAAQNIYKEWFVHLRFPRYENTAINEETGLPEGWEEKTISEVMEYKVDNRGKNPKYYTKSGIPVIDNHLIKNSPNIDLSKTKRYIDDELFDVFIRRYLKKDDVLITLVGTVANISLAPEEKSVIIQNTIGIRCNEFCTQEYMYCFLGANKTKIQNKNRGAAQPSVKVGDLTGMKMVIPNNELLNNFSKEIKTMFSLIQTLGKQNSPSQKGWNFH